MKVWLDDKRMAPSGFVRVRNLAEFQALLSSATDTIEVMSFDHDLGENEPSGYEIAKWLAANHPELWPKEVRVHSANPPGAEAIRAYDQFVRNRMFV